MLVFDLDDGCKRIFNQCNCCIRVTVSLSNLTQDAMNMLEQLNQNLTEEAQEKINNLTANRPGVIGAVENAQDHANELAAEAQKLERLA